MWETGGWDEAMWGPESGGEVGDRAQEISGKPGLCHCSRGSHGSQEPQAQFHQLCPPLAPAATLTRPAPPGQGEGFSLHWALPASVPCDCSRQVPNPVLVLGTKSHPLFGGLDPLHLFPGVGVQSLWQTWPTLLSWQGTRPAALTSRVGLALGPPPAQGIPSPAPRWAQTPSPGKPRPGRARG